MKYKPNPFAFGKIVKGKQFFNRKVEKIELIKDINDHQNIILYAPRRYGKTSLILNVFDDIKRKNKRFAGFYIDFYKINTVGDFLTAMSDEYAKNSGLSIDKILTSIKNIVRGVTPNMTVDESGKPRIELSVSPKSIHLSFEDIMKLPDKLSKEGMLVAVFFDEFQEISSLNGFNFQKKVRSFIQHQTKVSYIFCGSKEHLFNNIFTNPNNPLFRAGKTKYLNVIPEKEYSTFIHRNFTKIREDFSKATAVKIYRIAGAVPYNIQALCHNLYNLMYTNKELSIEKLLELSLETILEQKNEEFLFVYDSLNKSSRRALEIIIKYEGRSLFSQSILSEFIMPPSTLKKALNNLLMKELLYKEDNAYFFQDVFFEEWLKKRI